MYRETRTGQTFPRRKDTCRQVREVMFTVCVVAHCRGSHTRRAEDRLYREMSQITQCLLTHLLFVDHQEVLTRKLSKEFSCKT